jgi:CubicO group peptidase (beta-lactamase class C family)
MARSFRTSDPPPPIMVGTPPPPASRVPLDTWDRPPWNRWSFLNIREILPTVEVWRGKGHASRLDSAERELDHLRFLGHEGREVSLPEFLDASYTDGFIVLHRGRIVTERTFSFMGPRALHLSQSVAKSVTGATAGVLVDQGVVDPDAPVTGYVPELAATAYRGATLRHLLDMTSGVRFSEEYEDPFSDMGRVDVAAGWKRPPGPGQWEDCVFDVILTLTEKEREHGERFEYRSIETDVLAVCLERATGKRLATLVSELIWQPMGADESASFTVDRAGYGLADGGFNATLRDYARFGSLYLEDGLFNGRRIIPASWVEDTRRGDPTKFGPTYNSVLPGGAYRNQFWIENAGRHALVCRGVFGQFVYIAPDYEMVAVKLSTCPDFVTPGLVEATLRAMHAIGRELQG